MTGPEFEKILALRVPRMTLQESFAFLHDAVRDLPTYKEAEEPPAKGYYFLHGLTWVVEVKKGGTRKGRKTTLAYGHIQDTKGKDGEGIDFWMDPENLDLELFFVINQRDKEGEGFDEHKVMVGFKSEEKAKAGYLENYPEGLGEKLLGSVKPMTLPQFKNWLGEADKEKQASPLLNLQEIKARSDRGDMSGKAALLRSLIKDTPGQWKTDGQGKYPGVTHTPTNFQLHAPRDVAALAQDPYATREMTEADIPNLLGIEQESFPDDPYDEAQFKKWLGRGGGYVATHQDLPVGYMLHRPAISRPGTNYVQSIGVSKKHRRKGLATRLMNLVKDKGDVTLDVRAKNEPALKLYKKMGFKSEGANAYADGEPSEHLSLVKTAAAYTIDGSKVQGVGLRKTLHQLMDQHNVKGMSVNDARTGKVHAVIDADEPTRRLVLSSLAESLGDRGRDVAWEEQKKQERLKKVALNVAQQRRFVTRQGFNQLDAEPDDVVTKWLQDRYRLSAQGGKLTGQVHPLAYKQLMGLEPVYEGQLSPERAHEFGNAYWNRPEKKAVDISFEDGTTRDLDEVAREVVDKLRSAAADSKESRMLHNRVCELMQPFEEADDEEEHPYTVAVDLDGTLAEKEEPFNPKTIGPPRKRAKHYLSLFREAGARIIIFTVRGDSAMVKAWLDKHELPYDFVNENPDQPEGASGKVLADAYWDDRAFNAEDLDEHGPSLVDLAKGRHKAASDRSTTPERILEDIRWARRKSQAAR
jgi:ribosomal protein S18 acetylase RimI-like enzyme